MHAGNVDELNRLPNLEELAFGVFEADVPQLLEMPSLAELRKLILVDNRKNNIDLAPLPRFRRLETITVCGHARHIEALARCGTIRRLALNQMRKSVSLDFVRSMRSLRSLSIMLGGRANLDDVAHENLERLEVIRVRGLERVELKGVPALTWLHLEDQLQMRTLDLEPTRAQLRFLKIFNCKQLIGLLGIQLLDDLESLWLGRTAIDPEQLIALLPRALRAVSLSGYGTRRDAMLNERLRSLGYGKAPYLEQ